MNIKKNNILLKNISDIFLVWKREMKTVFSNKGVVIFLFVLPALYPLVYALIYNTEIVRELPMVIVDDSRTQLSRELASNIDATQNIDIISYCANMQEAKEMMNAKKCYAILHIPSDFSTSIARGEQANVNMFCEMSLLIRFRGYLVGVSETVLAMGAQLQQEMINLTDPLNPSLGKSALNSFSIVLGNTSQGFGTFLIPGILIILIQQSLLLGIAMLGGAARERRKLHGYDPLAIQSASVFSNMIGRSLCYFTVYIIPTIYLLHFIPLIFSYPQLGDIFEIFIFVMPMIFATIFMGMALQIFVSERESTFPILVFTSILFLFLSGLSWPRYAMNPFWIAVGDCIPAVWGLEGFIKMGANGSSLADVAHPYKMLWILTGGYFIITYIISKVHSKR